MEQKTDSYRWVMFSLGIALSLVCCIMMLLPSPLITTIVSETGWDVGMAGSLISIISLLMGIFVFVGSPLMDKLGVKMTALICLTLACVGGIIPFFAGDNYALHYAGRILFGIGYGIGLNVPAVIIPIWFPPKQQSTMQGVRTGLSYLGLSLAYYIIFPIYNGTGSWQTTFGIFGIVAGVVLVVFAIFGRNKQQEAAPAAQPGEAEKPKVKEKSGIVQAAGRKEVWMLWLGMLGLIWAFNTFNTYLPTYLEYERGYSAMEASTLTGTMTISGMVAGFVCGALGSFLGRRKVFGWPMFLLGIVGTLLTLYTSGFTMSMGIAFFGFAASAYTIMYSMVPADLPGSNPALYGGAMAIIIGGAYIPAYFMPNVFAALYQNGEGMTIANIFLVFSIMLVIGMIPLIIIKETGPKGKLAKERIAAEARPEESEA